MTGTYQRILLATEGTEFDAGAEKLAIELAAKFNVPLKAVMLLVTNSEAMTTDLAREEQAEAEAAMKLDRLKMAAAAQQVELQGKVRLGDKPESEVIDEAKAHLSDLIVVRRRGKRGYHANLVIGEMVQAIAQRSPCDVLIVPRAATLWSQGIVLATDGAMKCERATSVTTSFARDFALPVTAVSVVPKRNGDETAAMATIDRMLKTISAAGTKAAGRIMVGKAHKAILQAAEETRADLIVTERRGLNLVERVLHGSTPEQVAGYANVPVLIVKARTDVSKHMQPLRSNKIRRSLALYNS